MGLLRESVEALQNGLHGRHLTGEGMGWGPRSIFGGAVKDFHSDQSIITV